MLALVQEARRHVPSYGLAAPIASADVCTLAEAAGLQIHTAAEEMVSPAVLLPPWRGRHQLVLARWVSPLLERYVTLHEIAHVLGGDIDEPTIMAYEGPLPESEEVADLFALLGILDQAELEQGPEFVEQRIRELVPLDNYGWQTYRVPRLAGKVVELKVDAA